MLFSLLEIQLFVYFVYSKIQVSEYGFDVVIYFYVDYVKLIFFVYLD